MTFRMGKPSIIFGSLLVAGVLALTACNGPDAPAATSGTATETATATAPSSPPAAPEELEGGLKDFNGSVRFWESYWYSRYNLGNLVMMSGMGITFMPDMDMMDMVIQMVDKGPEEGEHVMAPQNPALLVAVFAGGDPHYLNPKAENPMDFAQYRWDPEKMDRALVPAAQAQTIIKEVEWAKFFHFESHFGKPSDDFGANQRFNGMVLHLEAKMQTQFALQNLMNSDGFFVTAAEHQDGQTTVTDASVNISDQFQMLLALSDISGLLTDQDNFPRYFDEPTGTMFRQAADMLFANITGLQPTGAEELSWGTRSLMWYAANTQDKTLQAQAIGLITDYGDALITTSKSTVADKARAIRGLIESYRLSADAKYLSAAADAFSSLSTDYDVAHGIFASQTTYSIEEVGHVLGAINALKRFGGRSVEQTRLDQILNGFFESVVNRSGLQLSAPPVNMLKGEYETKLPSELYYRYPSMPMPPMAGAPNGIAPVFASEVTFNLTTGKWSVTDSRFDTAGAMLASNEMNWYHNYATNGFPEITVLEETKLAEPKATVPKSTEPAKATVTPEAAPSVNIKGYAFDTTTVSVAVGSTVTWTNLDSATHTVTGDDFDSGNLANGKSWSHTFDTTGSFAYICSIHPTMHGEVVIVE